MYRTVNDLMKHNIKAREETSNFEKTVHTLLHSVIFGSTVTHSLVTVIQTRSILNGHLTQRV